jgi:hypothetical protein
MRINCRITRVASVVLGPVICDRDPTVDGASRTRGLRLQIRKTPRPADKESNLSVRPSDPSRPDGPQREYGGAEDARTDSRRWRHRAPSVTPEVRYPAGRIGRLARGRLSCDAWAEVVAEGIVTVAIRPCPDPALTLLLAPARPTMRGSQ